MNLLPILLSCLFALFSGVSASDKYREDLVLQPLPAGALLASFSFRANESVEDYESQRYRYFPRSLGQILQNAHTKELHLRFSSGRWDSQSWGQTPSNGEREGGTGVEVYAWIEAPDEDTAFNRWIQLNYALSGLFCASLNFIDSTRTTRPLLAFEPSGTLASRTGSAGSLHLLHGSLPREVVCTENLTPFLKLLPCHGKAGIATLLDGHKLFDSSWQSMSIDVQQLCEGEQCSIQLDQNIDMVLDIERSKRPGHDPIPRPLPRDQLECDGSKTYPEGKDYCYPIDLLSDRDWSLKSLFGREIHGSCHPSGIEGNGPASVQVKISNEHNVYGMSGMFEFKEPSGFSRWMTIPVNVSGDIFVEKANHERRVSLSSPPLLAARAMTGHGQERGGLQAVLQNSSPDHEVECVYFEALPWFMKPYLHTLHFQLNGLAVSREHVATDVLYRPGLDRVRGSQLELRLRIPPASTLKFSYDFDKAILRYTEYPPDANRGFDVASAVIRVTSTAGGSPTYLRTTSLLLPLPTPDFSMPYNVIILTSTVIALAFGNVFNLLTRRFVAADEYEGLTGLEKIKLRLAMLVSRITGRQSPADVLKKQQ